MTEAETEVKPERGTAGHYMHFLNWAELRGELKASTVQNWRNASTKVLEIEDDWHSLNVAEFDLDAHLSRFALLKRTSYTSGSMDAYKSRTRVGIESYRRWLNDEPNWKPKSAINSRSSRTGVKKSAGATPAPTPDNIAELKREPAGFVPRHAALIEYQVALRQGVRALLTLPEILSEKDAQRLVRFIQGLAVDTEDEALAE
jgi:hypothetical protein